MTPNAARQAQPLLAPGIYGFDLRLHKLKRGRRRPKGLCASGLRARARGVEEPPGMAQNGPEFSLPGVSTKTVGHRSAHAMTAPATPSPGFARTQECSACIRRLDSRMSPRQLSCAPRDFEVIFATPEPLLTPAAAAALLRLLQHHAEQAGSLPEGELSMDGRIKPSLTEANPLPIVASRKGDSHDDR